MFEVLLASNRLAPNVLESDRKAAEGREFYDDAYFEAFAAGTLTTLERRLNDAIPASPRSSPAPGNRGETGHSERGSANSPAYSTSKSIMAVVPKPKPRPKPSQAPSAASMCISFPLAATDSSVITKRPTTRSRSSQAKASSRACAYKFGEQLKEAERHGTVAAGRAQDVSRPDAPASDAMDCRTHRRAAAVVALAQGRRRRRCTSPRICDRRGEEMMREA